jgi:hypothetical protein
LAARAEDPAVRPATGLWSSISSRRRAIRPGQIPFGGNWQGVLELHGIVYHLTLHMNTTPEGKMKAFRQLAVPSTTAVWSFVFLLEAERRGRHLGRTVGPL